VASGITTAAGGAVAGGAVAGGGGGGGKVVEGSLKVRAQHQHLLPLLQKLIGELQLRMLESTKSSRDRQSLGRPRSVEALGSPDVGLKERLLDIAHSRRLLLEKCLELFNPDLLTPLSI
jgi:hypothetical protein